MYKKKLKKKGGTDQNNNLIKLLVTKIYIIIKN